METFKTISSQLERRFDGEIPIYARNAESHFGVSEGVREPAVTGGGRSRGRRFQGRKVALGQIAPARLHGPGDDSPGEHSLALALSVPPFVARARARAPRRVLPARIPVTPPCPPRLI